MNFFKTFVSNYKYHVIFNLRIKSFCFNFSTLCGKYNKSDKRKFLVFSNKPIKGYDTQKRPLRKKVTHINKKEEEKIKNFENKNNLKYRNIKSIKQNNNIYQKNIQTSYNNENIFLNKLNYNDDENKKADTYNEKYIMDVSHIKNMYVQNCLKKNNIFYIYTYQYLLIELLRCNKNVLTYLIHSDCIISYIIYSFYKINTEMSNNIYDNKYVNYNKNQNVDDILSISNPSKHKDLNILKHEGKKGKKKLSYSQNSVLLIVSSQEQISLIYETIVKLKSDHISTYIINNENNINNIRNHLFLYNIIIMNIEHIKDDYDFKIFLDHIGFLVVDDIYEIYKKKKTKLLKNILKDCKEKQETDSFFQILLINKIFDEWLSNDILQYLKSINYNIYHEKKKMNQYNFLNDNNSYYNNVNTFHCVNLMQYKPKIERHMSIYVPLNDEKKFLILFNILHNNKNKKRILIYYNKSDIYSFYLYLNSYIPCIFFSNTLKINYTKNFLHLFNTTNDYILITNDKTINKFYDLRVNLYIHYTLDDDITTYMDILSNHSIINLINVNQNNKNIQKRHHNNGKNNNNNNYDGDGDDGGVYINYKNVNEQINSSYDIESILFYNKKQYKTYNILNNLVNFSTYPLPTIKYMKYNFMNFLIQEIQNTLIDDNKHITEAEKIYEKYGHTFISAALYYIQKKKLFHTNNRCKSKTQYEHFSNIHFIIEKNVSINTKAQLMTFLNELLNFNKSIGDINFFIQNYIYSKRGYILSIPEHIYNILHKNKNAIENVEKYKHIHMYILYNNYQRDFKCSSVKRGEYKSKKAKRRLMKRINVKKEQIEINKLNKKLASSFKIRKRNVKNNMESIKKAMEM
ncbi:conserved Plasmodium protein, unknown function [Plasmodium sp. gorilla clade G2]|uniref:conserved Plasmodium protein, unknown function n=1 Tax=Plasmodium sp. gorilla clade G2 TaxID=880535 RepID=UPI000D216802|nr:conserved Plasmodium protein, unknown function [Plasmodium sp. gorilla clade G2]SOV15459.1 conserved Plasmodium protein, unknown function [Plasmodium sp. gorilla clade G2]